MSGMVPLADAHLSGVLLLTDLYGVTRYSPTAFSAAHVESQIVLSGCGR
jgi:hypothetical protein